MYNVLDVFEFWPDWTKTTELVSLEHPKKYTHWVIMVFFLVVYLLLNYSKYFDDLQALR